MIIILGVIYIAHGSFLLGNNNPRPHSLFSDDEKLAPECCYVLPRVPVFAILHLNRSQYPQFYLTCISHTFSQYTKYTILLRNPHILSSGPSVVQGPAVYFHRQSALCVKYLCRTHSHLALSSCISFYLTTHLYIEIVDVACVLIVGLLFLIHIHPYQELKWRL